MAAVADTCVCRGDCHRACPEGLQPHALWLAVQEDDPAQALALGLDACTGCAACDAACPGRLPLAATLVARRDSLRERQRLLQMAGPARRRYEARTRRLAREAQERQRREAQLISQATSGDAVEAAIARALARRKPPA